MRQLGLCFAMFLLSASKVNGQTTFGSITA